MYAFLIMLSALESGGKVVDVSEAYVRRRAKSLHSSDTRSVAEEVLASWSKNNHSWIWAD